MVKISLLINELKEALFSLKTNKSSGYDDVSFTVVKKCFGEINERLKHIFNILIENEKMKIAKIIPLFKNSDPLSCSRTSYITGYTNIYANKNYYFQSSLDSKKVVLQTIKSPGVFIDLSKASDSVDHSILLKKLEMYGANTTNLAWFASYLNGWKQYIKITECADTAKKDIEDGVPQDSILGPLLFLLYVNDLPNCSNVLDPIMFTNDTNFFFEHSNTNTLFKTVNDKLIKINEWFSGNTLSLNVGKTEFSLFHKSGKKCSIPSSLATLEIINHDIKRVNTMKFLGVLLDENLSRKKHIKYLKIK